MTPDPETLLSFWFGDDLEGESAVTRRAVLWFAGDADFDREIQRRFAELPDLALEGTLDGWRESPRGTLALAIALDQLPRNLYRAHPKAFGCDGLAREIAEQAIERGDDRNLHPLEAVFLYLPLEHAEDRAAQARCVALFESLLTRAPEPSRARYEGFLDYARRHQAVVERFGRFPHRNEVLGRAPTEDEREFLASGGDRF